MEARNIDSSMDILYCHRILRSADQEYRLNPDGENALTEERFSELLRKYKGQLKNWKSCVENSGSAQRQNAVGLTFDDGFRDFIHHALPHIESAEVRILLFVTTGFVDRTAIPYEYAVGSVLRSRQNVSLPSDLLDIGGRHDDTSALYKCLLSTLKPQAPNVRERLVRELLEKNDMTDKELELPEMLDWDDVSKLAQHPLVDIGGHTIRHPFLPSLGLADVWREVRGGKQLLEERLGRRIEAFAYTYGANDRRARCIVKAAGYKYGFTTANVGKGRMAIPRVNVVDWLRREY